MKTPQSLKASRAWPQYLGLTFFLAVGGFQVWQAFYWLTSDASFWYVFWLVSSSLFVAVIMMWLFGDKATQSYEVSPDALVATKWRKKQVVAWEYITEVDVALGFFGRTNLLIFHEDESLVIRSGQFANHKRLNRTIVEHAYRHNPDVKISKNIREIYSYPPYGGLTEKVTELQLG